MLKTLMKVQLLENLSFILRDPKSGKQRSKAAMAGFSFIYIALFASFGAMFSELAGFLYKPFSVINMDWLYFTMFGIIATALGIFLSIFSVYSTIYQSKDNEFLLALPIPPLKILIAKLLGIYLMTFISEAIALIPCYAVYMINGSFSATQLIFAVVNLFVLPLFALSISCILGWVIALIASKVQKNIRTFAIIIASVGFFGVYYYIMSDASDFMNMLISNPDDIAGFSKYVFYPIYAYGHGSIGEISSAAIYLAVVIVLFAVVAFVLSKTFFRFATKNKGSSSKRFEKQKLDSASVSSALLKREFSRLLSSPVYILNCCMGVILTILAAFFSVLKQDILLMIPTEYAGIIACGVIAMLSSMNDITAPSVSLEGKTLWILQSLPLKSWNVLKAKITMHVLVSAIPLLIFTAIIEVVFDMSLTARIMLPIYAVLFPFCEAVFGLMINLNMPNLTWKNETVAVKQGANVLAALLGSMGIIILAAVPYVIWNDIFSADVYIILAASAVLVVSVAMLIWIKKKGTEIFSKL